jgi:uncharacterized membrane protein YadS
MATAALGANSGDVGRPSDRQSHWRDLFQREDWWAIWLGVGIVVIAIALFGFGSTALKALAINPGGLKWTSVGQLANHFAQNAGLYVLQFAAWLAIFSLSCRVMGVRLREFIPSFVFLYLLSIAVFAAAGWADAAKFNLEPPLIALVAGLAISNIIGLPKWMDAGFRVEYYVKFGVILLGATFPIALLITAGPVAIGQATIVSLATCLTIYFAATRVFKLDRRLAALLGVGGSVCGVSASMAIAASVNAKKEHLYTTVTLVVGWALAMILVLPMVAQALGLSAGVGGAWIGPSDFADAAGFAAASLYGKMAGNEDVAVKTFTLMKVIGRDLWIGIWSLVWALIATLVWEKQDNGTAPNAMEVWWRFPKFVIGFFVASILMSAVVGEYSAAEFTQTVRPGLIAPIASLRAWAFIFSFLSIGLTTRFRELAPIGWRAFAAFTLGVAVNVLLGYFLSVQIFGSYWSSL